MSTLRITNIEAKADASSPSVDEKVKILNSDGDTLLQIDGATSGVSTVTVGTGVTIQGDSGIVTAKTFSGNISGVAGTFSGNLSVAGVLTYEDVTNVDSVGVVTARNGIRVGAGKSIGSDSGTVTYYGDGSKLTGIDASSLKVNNVVKVQATSSGSVLSGITTFEGTAIKLPRGTTAERPGVGSTSNFIRYNTSNSALEFYNGSNWVEIVSEYIPNGSTQFG